MLNRLKTQLQEVRIGAHGNLLSVSDIHQMLQEQFKPDTISAVEACRILKEAFPLAQHKRMTKEGVKQTYVLGVDMATRSVSTPSSSSQQAQSEISYLKERIRELEQSQSLLLQEVEALKKKVHEQETSTHLVREADCMIALSDLTSHGPDTISRLASFELDSVVSDLLTHSPELYRLFQTIGSTAHRLGSNTSNLSAVEDIKSLTSLCVLLNARSNRFRGVQLLLSLMLVARGTNR